MGPSRNSSDDAHAATGDQGESSSLRAPSIGLPKGGGAIRGIGEKFAANPVTGTGSLTVPICTSPGRSGFGPRLSLAYNSGAGNGPFGLGWDLGLPSITRKTDKGLPRYHDEVESDVFLLSDADDLVPVIRQDSTGAWVGANAGYRRDPVDGWVSDAAGRPVIHEDVVQGYVVRRYRPRLEGLFACIERWTRQSDPRDVHWRSISKDNILTVYGADSNSRIADAAAPGHIFSWLIAETRDDSGNAVIYRYKSEDGDGVDFSSASERNRGGANDPRRATNRYIKHILYGNRQPLTDANAHRPRFLDRATVDASIAAHEWMFEVAFDYGEHDEDAPRPDDPGHWSYRQDPFSSYRSGFEIRTTRLCRRALMFHHFPDAAGVGVDCLVKSTDFAYSGDADSSGLPTAAYSYLKQVTQRGYRRKAGAYVMRALPPLELDYRKPRIEKRVRRADPATLANLPIGIAAGGYRWVDLHGEGVPGVLHEHGGAWLYKRNVSPLPVPDSQGVDQLAARLSPAELVRDRPNVLLAGGVEIMDLAGDGLPDIVQMSGPLAGLYEHDEGEGWQAFKPFTARLNRDLGDPNVRIVDLDGDGQGDVLITENDAFVWHASLAEAGFGPARRVNKVLDEEKGPRIVFADGTESIYLADMSGDGLMDLVRIRNGDVCYWPNLGYGRFGAKVQADDSPRFDSPGDFDQKRLRLADIDGSGTTDIVYLHRDGVRLYFNQCGNAWSDAVVLSAVPRPDQLGDCSVVDLLGNGTSCLVWSSPLPDRAGRQLLYLGLIGKYKPHLLIRVANNVGAETRIEYAPSTKFYLDDKRNGRPWVTRLAFPVNVVERVTTYDHVSRNQFVTRYAYHHGHFDGDEREFRGFGMVEHFDFVSIAEPARPNAPGPAANVDAAFHVPPVVTRTWYHTGVFHDSGTISRHFEDEYFREPAMDLPAARALLLDDTILPAGLSPQETREACRALKGSMLRQEVYADDDGARRRYPYSVTEQNFSLRLVQARAGNRHAVFLTHARESLTYHYERDPADPRVQHALTLEVDEFGNALKQAQVGYGRRATVLERTSTGAVRSVPNPGLAALDPLDQAKQATTLVTYTETRMSNAVEERGPDWETYRTPIGVGTATFELTGYAPSGSAGRYAISDMVEPDPSNPPRLRARFQAEVPFEAAAAGARCRRMIACQRSVFRADDLATILPWGTIESRALASESYVLAMTPGLIDSVYRRQRSGAAPENLLPSPGAVLPAGTLTPSDRGGYVASERLKADGRFPASDVDGHWWIPSGQGSFSADPAATAAQEIQDARQHFFLHRRYRDPFGNDSTVTFDADDLLIAETRDALDNRVTVVENDYRVLQPRVVGDPNGNRAAVAFDALGLVVATAVLGKPALDAASREGDSLDAFEADPPPSDLLNCLGATDPLPLAIALLGDATSRIIYDVDAFRRTKAANPLTPALWRPVAAMTIARDTHVFPAAAGPATRHALAVAYSDGFGRIVQGRRLAEPGPLVEGGPTKDPRWIVSGWTVFNNKGKPVRRFEPFFDDGHEFEFGTSVGVSSIAFYDPMDRVVATIRPDHSYEKTIFTPWIQSSYDANDTVAPRNAETGDVRTDPDVRELVRGYFASLPATVPPWETWYQQRVGGALGATESAAALRAAAHADTPTVVHFDALGRSVVVVAHNRVQCPGHDLDGSEDRIRTRVDIDVQGRQLRVYDAFDRIVVAYRYDMLGRQIFQQGMEAGARWKVDDVQGKCIRAWDGRGHNTRTAYDALRRPVEQYVRGTTGLSDPRTLGRDLLVDRVEYGEALAGAETLNLRTRVLRHWDSAGVITNARLDSNGAPVEAFDFEGNALHSTRQLAKSYSQLLDWSAPPDLLDERFESSSRFDALGREIQTIAPHSDLGPATQHVVQPRFDRLGLLKRVDVWLDHAPPAGLLDAAADAPDPVGVTNVDYDAKSQRSRIDYKNGASTFYRYDREMFRLKLLYTRRGPAYDHDAENPGATPPVSAAPDTPVAGRKSGVQHLRYAYDAFGNVVHVEDDAQQPVFFDNRQVLPDADYVYDAQYRLVQATGREHLGRTSGVANAPGEFGAWNAAQIRLAQPGDGDALGTYVERYVYDLVGNVLACQHRGSDPQSTGWTRNYAYSERSLIEDGTAGPPKTGNRLSSSTVQDSNGVAVVEPLLYDVHGNVVRMAHLGSGSPGPNLAWDYKDRLIGTDQGGGGKTFYVYDSSGQRVRKVNEKMPGMTEERIYLGGLEVYRRHEGNVATISAATATLERTTLHVMDDRQRIALVESRTRDTRGADKAPARLVRYQHANYLGSACLELDEAADIISYEEYSPYGSTTYQSARSQAETPKRYRFTGKERDEESGFYYHGARYYAPWLGRWISCDPAGLVDGPCLYQFSRLNPVSVSDTTGLAGAKPQGSIGNVAPYNKQGKALWKNGVRISEHEHVMPRGNQEALTYDRATGKSDYGARQYRKNTTLTVERETALNKTHANRGGANADNARTSRLQAKAQQGDAINYREEVFNDSIENMKRAASSTGSKVTEAQINEAALAQDGELFGIQRMNETGGRIGATAADVDAVVENLEIAEYNAPEAPAGATETPAAEVAPAEGAPAAPAEAAPTAVEAAPAAPVESAPAVKAASPVVEAPVGGRSSLGAQVKGVAGGGMKVLGALGVAVAAKEVAKDIKQGNYGRAAVTTGMTGLSFTPAAPVVMAAGIIQKYHTDKSIEQRSFEAGDIVMKATGSAVAGGLVSAGNAVGLSIWESGKDFAHAVHGLFTDW